MIDYRVGEAAPRVATQFERLDEWAELTEAQESALNRGDLFAAVLLAEMDTTPWTRLARQASPLNAVWAGALQEHADDVHTRMQHALATRLAATRPLPASPTCSLYRQPSVAFPAPARGREWAA